MARGRIESRLIRFVEKETGMKFKVKPRIVYTRNRKVKAPWQKRSHEVSYSNYIDAEQTGKRVKIKKAVVQALAARGYIAAKGMKRPVPAVKPLIHELVENLYEQHHLKSLNERHVKRVTAEAHRYASKMEGKLTKKYVEKYGVPE
ncbi:MAG: hypothetical protein JHC26_08645 [Thermofilum sp.]|jgi:hypothetical protein|uniref:hypothetical protein n=1 Tax=Thermofilum sp. TaxID=1961369 RepID=UPI002588778E|nr:hypothetical protein [Thermofilum sp.]MCI4409145.1 hypothetical protein [Thermofilum sp.]